MSERFKNHAGQSVVPKRMDDRCIYGREKIPRGNVSKKSNSLVAVALLKRRHVFRVTSPRNSEAPRHMLGRRKGFKESLDPFVRRKRSDKTKSLQAWIYSPFSFLRHSARACVIDSYLLRCGKESIINMSPANVGAHSDDGVDAAAGLLVARAKSATVQTPCSARLTVAKHCRSGAQQVQIMKDMYERDACLPY